MIDIDPNKEISLSYKKIDLSKEKDIEFLKKNPSFQEDLFNIFKTNFTEPEYKTNQKEFIRKRFEKESIIYLVKDKINNKVIGLSVGHNFTDFKNNKGFYLDYFAVDKKYQKKQIGTKLLFRTFADLRKNNYKVLDLYAKEGTKNILDKLVGKKPVYKNKLRKLPNNEYSFSDSFKNRIKMFKRK